MPFLASNERTFLKAVSQLAYCNPFLPERTEFERAVLGREFVEGEPIWSRPMDDPERPRPNVWRVMERLPPFMEELRARLIRKNEATDADLVLYEDATLHLLYNRTYPKFFEASFGADAAKPGRCAFYQEFLADWRHFFQIEATRFPSKHDPRHTFAC